MKNVVYGAGAAFFLPGAGADAIRSEPAPGPPTSGAAQKVAAPQHCPLYPIFHTSQHLLN